MVNPSAGTAQPLSDAHGIFIQFKRVWNVDLEMPWYWRYKYHIFFLFLFSAFLIISGDLIENNVLYLLGQIVFSIVGVIIFISIIQIAIEGIMHTRASSKQSNARYYWISPPRGPHVCLNYETDATGR